MAAGAAAAAAMLSVASLRQRMAEQLFRDAQHGQLAQNLQAIQATQAMMAMSWAYPTAVMPEAEVPTGPAAEAEIEAPATQLPPGVVSVHGQVAPYLQEAVMTETAEATVATTEAEEVASHPPEVAVTEVAEAEAATAEAPEAATTVTSTGLPPETEVQVIEDLKTLAGTARSSEEVEAVQALLRSIGARFQEAARSPDPGAASRPAMVPQAGPASAKHLAGFSAIKPEALAAWQRSEDKTTAEVKAAKAAAKQAHPPGLPGSMLAKPAEAKSTRTGVAERMAKYGVRSAREALDKTGVVARSLTSDAVVRYLSASEVRENAEKAAVHEREVREASVAAKDAGVWADAGDEQTLPPVPSKPKALTLTPPPEPAGTAASAAKATMWPPAPPPVPEPSGPPPSLVLVDSGVVGDLTGSAASSRSELPAAKARPAVPEPKGPPPKPKQGAPPAAEESDD